MTRRSRAAIALAVLLVALNAAAASLTIVVITDHVGGREWSLAMAALAVVAVGFAARTLAKLYEAARWGDEWRSAVTSYAAACFTLLLFLLALAVNHQFS